ncbi:MAG: ABC transporter permease [Archangium sp.]|nr:ABC transporter permease [Archangium sp.]
MLWLIAARSLLQHRLRTSLLMAAIGGVTALLVMLTGAYVGIKTTLLVSATTLMSGHVNVAGFYKATASSSAPVVTNYKKVRALVEKEVPQVDYIVQRGRGWAKLVSESATQQAGLGGIDITHEPGFRKVVQVKEGSIDGLTQPNGILIFEAQAKRLSVKVGDTLTIVAPTFRGTNNTLDVTVVAIAADIGMLSSWNTFMNDQGLRQLYQLNDETTGALQIYLKDIEQVKLVQEQLRTVLAREGFGMLDPDPRPFFAKFDGVNRENWTGQRLDVTNWEDETNFVQWIVTALTVLATIVIFALVAIIAVGIMNVMWISIRERTREIGTLRAVGMQRGTVLSMFLAEGSLLGLIGTIVGGIGGVLGSIAVSKAGITLPPSWQFVFFSDHLVITPTLTWVGFSVGFITVAIAGISLIPSFLAARLKPITAMSHVG